jgi:hypothetical protein
MRMHEKSFETSNSIEDGYREGEGDLSVAQEGKGKKCREIEREVSHACE